MNSDLINRFNISAIALACLVASGQASAASDYNYIDLGPGRANDINKSGQIAGADGGNAVIWSGTSKTVLGTGAAIGLNDLGQAVGLSGPHHPVLWEDGKTLALPNFPADYVGDKVFQAEDLNNAGQIIGGTGGNLPTEGVYWENKAAPPEIIGFRSDITAINEKGQFVVNDYSSTYIQGGDRQIGFNGQPFIGDINDAGHAVGSFGSNPALWIEASGQPVTLDKLPGYRGSVANDINNHGEIVGWSADTSEEHMGRAIMWDSSLNHNLVDLNTFLPTNLAESGWILTRAYGINDSGLIVGLAYNSSLDVQHSFVLSPIPEPETYALMLAGLAVLGWQVRRGRKQLQI